MLSEFYRGVSSYFPAIGMISRHRLWKYVLIPSLLSFLLISFLIAWPTYALLNSSWSDQLLAFTEQKILNNISWEFLDNSLRWIFHSLEWILQGLFVVFLIAFMFFFLGKYIVMIVVSPFMSILSEKVEMIYTGKTVRRKSNFLSDLIRGLRIALRNALREITLTLFFLLFQFIPGIGNLLGVVLTFMVQSFYAGFGNMDFTLERKFNMKESVRFVKQHRALATGNGAIFLLIFFIPVLGWFLAPAYGTIAAATVTLDTLSKEKT